MIRGAEGGGAVIPRRVEAHFVVQHFGFISVDMPLSGAGGLAKQAAAGEGMVEIAGLTIKDVGVGFITDKVTDEVDIARCLNRHYRRFLRIGI